MYIFDIEHMEGTCGIFHFWGKKLKLTLFILGIMFIIIKYG